MIMIEAFVAFLLTRERPMLRLLCNKKGMSMAEVLVAVLLTSVGIMALLALQPTGWKTMAKADYVGRASGILYKTLEDNENCILNPCCTAAMGTTTTTVKSSDQSTTITGDITYTVTVTMAADAASTCSQPLVDVTVTVKWPPLNSKGISETMVVGRQENFRFPTGCANQAPAPTC
jgi:Tfp pilus assembly protein PilV